MSVFRLSLIFPLTIAPGGFFFPERLYLMGDKHDFDSERIRLFSDGSTSGAERLKMLRVQGGFILYSPLSYICFGSVR